MVLAGAYASPEIQKAAKQIQPAHRQLLCQPGSVAHLLSGDRKIAVSGRLPAILVKICALAHPGSGLQPGLPLLYAEAPLPEPELPVGELPKSQLTESDSSETEVFEANATERPQRTRGLAFRPQQCKLLTFLTLWLPLLLLFFLLLLLLLQFFLLWPLGLGFRAFPVGSL